jgi:hypothetical protein
VNTWRSVEAAFPTFTGDFEGRCSWLYLDTEGYVTTAVGYLCDSVAAAQALPWLRSDGTEATPVEIAEEWRRIKAMQASAPMGGGYFRRFATLHLAERTIDELTRERATSFVQILAARWPSWPLWPADAQLAVLDMAWNYGPRFPDKKLPDGHYMWVNFRAALADQDWTRASLTCLSGDPRHSRNRARVRLFSNAAKVKRWGLNPADLWNLTPPKEPGPVINIHHSNAYHSDYVWFQGGWVPPKTYDILVAVQLEGMADWGPIRLSQGGLSTGVVASASTHAGLGAFDIAIDGRSKAKVWRLCSRLLRSGVVPFPRGYVNDSFQGNKHIHAVRDTGAPPLHRQAYDQLRSSSFGYFHGGGGLAGRPSLRYPGPSTKLEKWDASPYNPANIRPGGTVYMVAASKLLGLDVDRNQKVTRAAGYGLTAVKEVRRWGRWNAVTAAGIYYAIGDGLLVPNPALNQEPTP